MVLLYIYLFLVNVFHILFYMWLWVMLLHTSVAGPLGQSFLGQKGPLMEEKTYPTVMILIVER